MKSIFKKFGSKITRMARLHAYQSQKNRSVGQRKNEYSKIIDEKVLANWFSSTTKPDRQLADFISRNNFETKSPTYSEVCDLLFGNTSPYSSYVEVDRPPVMNYPSHIGAETLRQLEEQLGERPKLAIEVGSFIGSSGTVLGKWLQQTGGILICVDPWCGDVNMWLRSEFAETMSKADGNPKLFDHFMSKMISENLTDTVIPFRTTSITAARVFNVTNWQIDLIYLDSAHEFAETFLEISLLFDVLRPGGLILGDDYQGFPAVKHDIDLFCEIHGVELTFTGERDTWFIIKP